MLLEQALEPHLQSLVIAPLTFRDRVCSFTTPVLCCCTRVARQGYSFEHLECLNTTAPHFVRPHLSKLGPIASRHSDVSLTLLPQPTTSAVSLRGAISTTIIFGPNLKHVLWRLHRRGRRTALSTSRLQRPRTILSKTSRNVRKRICISKAQEFFYDLFALE